VKLKLYGQMLREAASEWLEDKAPRMGAALAYYSVFSVAPLLLIVIAVAGHVFGREAAEGRIVEQIRGTVGDTAARAIEEIVKSTQESGAGTVATVVGLAVLLFGASGVFVELQDALNTIWRVKPKPGRGLWTVVRDRLFSFTVVLGTGFLLLVSLVVSAALAALRARFQEYADRLPGGSEVWTVANLAASFALVALLFAMIYKVLPDAKVAWRDVWVGAVFTALLFTLGRYLVGLYVARGGLASAFGAAGSVIVVLVWVYYSAQLVLFGAEFTRVHARHSGSKVLPADNAVAVTPEERARQGMVPAGQAPRPVT
jgi:membrane protein